MACKCETCKCAKGEPLDPDFLTGLHEQTVAMFATTTELTKPPRRGAYDETHADETKP